MRSQASFSLTIKVHFPNLGGEWIKADGFAIIDPGPFNGTITGIFLTWFMYPTKHKLPSTLCFHHTCSLTMISFIYYSQTNPLCNIYIFVIWSVSFAAAVLYRKLWCSQLWCMLISHFYCVLHNRLVFVYIFVITLVVVLMYSTQILCPDGFTDVIKAYYFLVATDKTHKYSPQSNSFKRQAWSSEDY